RADIAEAGLRLLRYPEGATVKVRYDPSNPAIAVAQPGFHASSLWLPGAGLAFIVPAIMFYLLFRSSTGGSANGMKYGAMLFAFICIAIGMVMLTPGLIRLWHAYDSQRWPKAAGLIITGRGAPGKVPLVYRYEVDGQNYYSNVRVFG